MSLQRAEVPDWLGAQRPRVWSAPPFTSSTGVEAIRICEVAGLYLDPWQEFWIEHSLGESPDWKCSKCPNRHPEWFTCPRHPRSALIHPWSAFEVGGVVPRQNGKGGVIEARELAGLFVIESERLIIHSAHEFATAMEAFGRMEDLIDGSPTLRKRVRSITHSHGSEGFILKNGKRLLYKTRTKGAGRGFSSDLLILDVAMIIADAMYTAILPTLIARPNSQVWYMGSAVDQAIHESGVVFARVHERGLAGGDDSLAYFDWSAADSIEDFDLERVNDPEEWARANPALGIRISLDQLHKSRRAFGSNRRGFAVEHLAVGDWPRTDDNLTKIIHPDAWDACFDPDSKPLDPICIAFDVSPERKYGSIAISGYRSDGLMHVEIDDCRGGSRWIIKRLKELNEKHKPASILCDGYAAGALVADIEAEGVTVVPMKASEHAQACGIFFDSVMDTDDEFPNGRLRHLGGEELDMAVNGAKTRPLGDAWAWDRKNSEVDLTPLVACTLALWGTVQRPQVVKASVINMRDWL